LACLYYEVGKLPQKLEIEINEAPIHENLAIAPYKFKKAFELVESLHVKLKESLYNFWLNKLISGNYIVQPETLIQLLFSANGFSKETKSKITRVIGNKGNWILSLNPVLQYGQITNNDNVWTEGNTNDRKIFLIKTLDKDPEEAINLLKATWETEPLVNKKSFLEILKDYKDLSIIGFADTLYRGEFAFKAKEKKTEKECRKVLAEILLGFEETLLYQETVSKLNSYFNVDKKKGLLGFGSKSQVSYQLPETEDSRFWNPANMEQTYGFETKNYDIALFNNINQYWLSCFLSIFPVDVWLPNFQGSYQAFLSCFISSEEFKINESGEMKSVFFNTILENAIKFRDNALSVALLPTISPINAVHLLKNLKPDEYEQYVKKNKLFADENILANGPYSLSKSWSFAFCNYIITNVYEMAMQGNTYYLSGLGIVISQFVHIDVVNLLEEYTARARYTPYSQNWENNVYNPISKVIQIKKLLMSGK